jgi:hypothetical protein
MKLSSCPVCRARFTGEERADEVCRRCGSKLELLRNTYALAQYYQHLARYTLVRDDFQRAYDASLKANILVDNPETRKTLMASLISAGRVNPAADIHLAARDNDDQ